ncbi:MAG: GspE/PulE family protein [bacterium]
MSSENKKGDIPEIDLANYIIDAEILNLVPAAIAEKYELIPLFKVGKSLTVAMADPNNIMAVDHIKVLTSLEIAVVKSEAKAIHDAISEYYGITGVVDEVLKAYRPQRLDKKVKAVGPKMEEAPVIKLVNAIVAQAVKEAASDIHIEPEASDARVRYRVDGLLHEEFQMPPYMLAPVVSRIKVLSGMDIAESRVPQDGRFELKMEERHVDFRVSTFPSAYGEKVVLRILDKSKMSYKLPDIGFSESNLEKFRKVVKKPHGIILVTGPTGSGKSTTLYGALAEVDCKELNVVTVEDPIEYELPGITQSQINTKAGLTFATALRALLRQDPDIILVGEIRDMETAGIAVQAALTGHLVFSTLHTNDAAGALTRLADMGIEPFLISSTVEAVLAQRLVRKICPKCRQQIEVPASLKKEIPDLTVLYKGKGCRSCKETGYKGRTGIFELLVTSDNIGKMIAEKKTAESIKEYAVQHGMRTLYNDGLEKVKAGLTTIDEVLRVTELE